MNLIFHNTESLLLIDVKQVQKRKNVTQAVTIERHEVIDDIKDCRITLFNRDVLNVLYSSSHSVPNPRLLRSPKIYIYI